MRWMNHSALFGRVLFGLTQIVFMVTGCAAGGDMLDQGQPMAEFSLEAHDGSTVTGSDLDGHPYLLYFYVKADTPG